MKWCIGIIWWWGKRWYGFQPVIGVGAMKTSRASVLKLTGAMIMVALAVFILWPQHIHREREFRPKCAANLKAIGQALVEYAIDHGGQFPPSLAVVLEFPDMDSSVFVCPATKDTPATAATTQHIVEELSKPGHLSYIYLGATLRASETLPAVLVYEPLGNHGHGLNALYADGTVEFVDRSYAEAFLAELHSGHNPPRAEMLK